jgi:hypothetical protein
MGGTTSTSFSRCTIPRLCSKLQADLGGHDQVRDWFAAGYENVQPRILPEAFVAGGDTVVGLGRIEIRWVESGEIAQEGESAGAYWFRDGKIIKWQPFETHAAALEETGLGE